MHSPKRKASLPMSLSRSTSRSDASLGLPRSITLPLSFLNSFTTEDSHSDSSSRYSSPKHPSPPRFRRQSTVVSRFARLRLVQVAIAASIPILAILLLAEFAEHRARHAVWHAHVRAQETWADGQGDLASWRSGLARRRTDRGRGIRRGRARARDMDAEAHAEYVAETETAWPLWWGSADHVASPYDFVPAPAPGPKRRILFLTDYKDYLERMNTHTYEIVDAALRHPNAIVDVWGPGWAGYDRTVPLSENVRRRAWRVAQLEESKTAHDEARRAWFAVEMERMERKLGRSWGALDMGRAPVKALPEPAAWEKPEWKMEDDGGLCHPDTRFDVVWTISDIFKQADPHVDALGCGALLVQQVGDCHSSRCLKEWYPLANNITLSKYAFELREIFDYDTVKARFPEFELGMFGHSPDTGNEWDFYPMAWKDKTRGAVTFGFDGSFYPIRTAITSHLNSLPKSSNDSAPTQSTFLIQRHQHPGYTIRIPPQALEAPLETYDPAHEYYATHRRLREDFAHGMRTSRVCVFDASLERKMIRKYAQAMLSGCVIAGDLPTEQEEALGNFVIPLEADWGWERIAQQVQTYLDQPELLERMALEAFAYARAHLTTRRKVSDVLDMAEAYRAGERGYVYPHSFASRCRAYWSNEAAYRPPWCEGTRGLETGR